MLTGGLVQETIDLRGSDGLLRGPGVVTIITVVAVPIIVVIIPGVVAPVLLIEGAIEVVLDIS